jgi:hypothetical protein
MNLDNASDIDGLTDAVNITSTGDDAWGSTEVNSGDQSRQDALPPYTTVAIGGPPVQLCSVGSRLPPGYNVFFIGDCSVSLSEYSSDTAACNEPATPPLEQCWTVTVQ